MNTPSVGMTRRRFVRGSAAGLAAAGFAPSPVAGDAPRRFRLWAVGDAHVGTDIARKRESLADAIRHSERGGEGGAPPFDWDIAINVGDFSGNQGPPEDDEGREVVRQYAALTKHRREDFYDIAGNHDASGQGQPTLGWFRKWVAAFINCCALTRWHVAKRSRPMSRLLTFTEGSAEVRVECYLHTNTHAPLGWYAKAGRVITLNKPFRMG